MEDKDNVIIYVFDTVTGEIIIKKGHVFVSGWPLGTRSTVFYSYDNSRSYFCSSDEGVLYKCRNVWFKADDPDGFNKAIDIFIKYQSDKIIAEEAIIARRKNVINELEKKKR